MTKFERYTVEQLNHWIWGYQHITPFRTLFTEEDYKKALNELNKRTKVGD